MKISKFIELLKTYNQNADITLTYSEDITLSYICKDKDYNDLTKEDTPIVFIEPVDECPQCVHEYMGDDDERWCSFYGKPCKMIEECFQFEEFDER